MDRDKKFARHIDKVPGCWLWKGYRTVYGYGMSYHNGKRVPAHRLSWTVNRGPIPRGKCVLHRCDSRACVNPEHLFIGTKTDNAADRHAKNRDASGETHGRSKLTAPDVVNIRATLAKGEATQRALAIRYGVAKSLIWAIHKRKIWA